MERDPTRPGIVIVVLWLGWLISWLLAALWSNQTERRPAVGTEIRYRIPMMFGVLLMFVPAHGYEGTMRLWHIGWYGAWLCVAGVAIGIGIAWWARLHLGRLWSVNITRKADHRVVDTGPYAAVRNPIYSGLLLSLLATAAAKGTLLGVAGFLLLLLGVWMKAWLEERWPVQELDQGAYADYRKRVPMLIPFGPKN